MTEQTKLPHEFTARTDEAAEKAVVTVIGKDNVGILANVAGAVSEAHANVIEVSQSVLSEFFCMIMIIDITRAVSSVDELQQHIEERCPGIRVHVMHENIFSAMHRI